MADSFDPYHVWLGISPANQPPNHYRLLGIELFERSGDVIDAAASRQSMTLRDFTSGEHSTLAEKLLDEVKAARFSLLNSAEKSKYDEKLRSELTNKGVAIPDPPGGGEEASPGYHLWLGITPELQPPTHYRLLGLDPFESSEQVIEAGADRQSRYLREVAVGKQRKQSQSLLNEVSAARRCLLDAEKRKAYDEELQLKVEQAEAAKEVEPAKTSATPKVQAAESGESATSKPEVPEASTPSPQQSLTDAPKTDGAAAAAAEVDTASDTGNIGSSQSATGKIDQPVPESASSAEPDKTQFPALVEPSDPTKAKTKDSPPDSEYDSRQKMFVIIGSVAAILVGTGLFLWLPGSEKPESRKTASAKSKTKDVSEEDVKAKEQKAAVAGQLAHWTFDEKNPKWAANETGPLVLTLLGSPKFEAGPMGQAVRLDGEDDSLELPQGAFIPDTGTISFWFRRDSDTGGPLLLLQGEQAKFALWLTGQGQLLGSIGPEPARLAAAAILAPGQWYHLALTWRQDGNARLFCNAEQISHVKDAGPFGIPQKLTMGLSIKETTIMASLDDVQCFDRALEADELAELVEGSSVTLKPPVPYEANQFDQLLAASKLADNPTKPPGKPAPNPRNSRAAKRKAAAAKAAAAKKAAAVPKPPPLRTVQLPLSQSNVSSLVWKNVGTKQFSTLVNSQPTSKPSYRRLPSLAAGTKESAGPNAFQRVRGILIPPVDGPYKFHVAFVDEGKFLLSTGLHPSGRKEVKNGQTVELSGKQAYYFELFHLDKSGKGSFRIGWTFPNGAKEATIPAGRLRWTRHLENFVPLPISNLECSESLTVQQIKDSDLILASGDSRAASKVTVDFQSDVTTYTAFRLDAVVNEELLSNGPGLGSRGMFSLSEITLEYQEPGSTTFVPVPLNAPIAHYGAPAGLVDGKVETKWSVRGRNTESTSVILVPKITLTVSPQSKFRLTLHQETPLGLFRVLGTAGSATWQVETMQRQMEKAAQPFSLHVNLGGRKWTDPGKTTWVSSKAYQKGSWGHEGGQPVAVTKKGAGSQAMCLNSVISGLKAFRADLPNGRYDVTLFFGEQWVTKPGQRVFTIQVESDPPVRVDSFVSAGSGKVFAPSAPVVVKDGRLDIVFKKVSGAPPMLNAISITE